MHLNNDNKVLKQSTRNLQFSAEVLLLLISSFHIYKIVPFIYLSNKVEKERCHNKVPMFLLLSLSTLKQQEKASTN